MYDSPEHGKQVKRLIDKDVLCNQSALVEALIKNGWEGNEPNIDWDMEIVNMRLTEDEAKDLGFESLEEAQDNSQDYKEVFEWWLITDWLAHRLEHLGCVVVKSEYGTWWGRTETGQALTMDGDIKSVAAYLIKR